VNAAAARAAMMNNQRQAGITQSYGGKSDAFGANQTVSKGVNLSAGDMISGGYGAYRNPSAGLAMAARPNTTVANKGVNLSSGDLLAGGYGQYRQAPSMQSTPQTAGGGWNDLAGLQAAVSGMQPTFGNIVAGTLRSPLGKVTSNGEIGSIALNGQGVPEQQFANAGYGQIPSQIAQINYGQTPVVKDISRLASAPDIPFTDSYYMNKTQLPAARYADIQQGQGVPSIDSVPSLPNYSAPVSVANREPTAYDPASQVAAYQNPARAFPSRSVPPQTASLASPMSGNGQTFRSPASAAQYNRAMTGLLGAPTRVAEAPASSSDPGATSDYGLYDQPSTPTQKVRGAVEGYIGNKTASLKKAGDYVNGLLGGSGYNDLYGNSNQSNPNARDVLNTEHEKVQQAAAQAVAAGGGPMVSAAANSPEFKALNPADQKTVLDYIRQGMTLEQALAKLKSGTGAGTGTGGNVVTPAVYYPQYYSTWAGLPSGQRYG